jgi:hypothetical protein
MNKLFIIGLPRTGTTSVSVALLDYGFKVAHTAYTKRAFELADVVSDAPCFCDYAQLDKLFPNSKFVYLNRALQDWIPSMQRLLIKMLPELHPKTGYLHPILKRSIQQTFALSTSPDALSNEHLTRSYLKHQQQVMDYFSHRDDFLMIDVAADNSLNILLNFINIPANNDILFPTLNVGKTVDSWKEIKHPNKINSLSAGKEHRAFFDYQS